MRHQAMASTVRATLTGVVAGIAIMVFGGSAPALASAQLNPDLTGHWHGQVGSALERVPVGLRLDADEAGGFRVRLTLPVGNYHDLAVGGLARLEEGVLTHPALNMRMAVEGDRLTGSLLGPDQVAQLQRASSPLPIESQAAGSAVSALTGPRWTTRLNGMVFAAPVLADAVVYVGSTGGVLTAVDAHDGRIVWAVGVGHPMLGAARVAGDTVYVVSDGGYLHALDRSDGSERWRVVLDAGRQPRVLPHPAVFDWDWQAPQPVIVGDRVYVGGADGVFHALDAGSGEVRWRFATGGRIRHGAAVGAGRVLVASESGVVFALALDDGQEQWRYRLEGKPGAAVVVAGGQVFVAGRDAYLHALDEVTGALRWRLGFWGSWVESAPVVDGGILYVGSSDLRRISAIDPASGRVHWRTDVGGWSWGTPLLLDGQVVVGTAGGAPYAIPHRAGLVSLARADGRVLGRYDLADTGGHNWGIAGGVVDAGDTLIAAGIEGWLKGFDRAAILEFAESPSGSVRR